MEAGEAMTEFFEFAKASPFLALCIIIATYYAIKAPFVAVQFIWNRYMRSKNIAARGWPTAPNMDADGDIVHPEKE
jgi:hypothetical protein